MSSASDSVKEIKTFLDNLTIPNPLVESSHTGVFHSAYKHIHPLLLWNEVLLKVKKSPTLDNTLLFFNELLSDLSSSQFLLLLGLYKPSRMMLRSSIENLLRMICIHQGFIVGNGKFTHELITMVKSSQLAANTSPVSKDLIAAINSYYKLCAYTHAADANFMSLRVPFIKLQEFDIKDFRGILEDIRLLCMKYNRIMFSMHSDHIYRTKSYRFKDAVLDTLPRSLKAQFAGG